MSHRVDPKFIKKLSRYGAFDIKACFNCGNCTAVCPHSEENETFPRRLIRYGQLGLKDELAGSKELWVCYYCGECSDTCPREAEPGEFMASARRYAIASNDITGIGRLFLSSWLTGLLVTVIGAVILFWVLLQGHGPWDGRFFQFVSGEKVHDVGVWVLVIMGVFTVIGVINMIRRSRIAADFAGIKYGTGGIGAVIKELFTQKRYQECADEYNPPDPWYKARWFIHWAIFWGFIGLLFATTWDFVIKPKDQWGMPTPFFYPPRIVGTIAALFFLYGTSMALIQRIFPKTKYARHSRYSDWFFVVTLFFLAVTGILLEIFSYFENGFGFANFVFLIHMVAAFELVVFLPFSKFAHAIYRIIAIFLHGAREKKTVPYRQVA